MTKLLKENIIMLVELIQTLLGAVLVTGIVALAIVCGVAYLIGRKVKQTISKKKESK